MPGKDFLIAEGKLRIPIGIVLLIGNRDSLCCDAADMESFLTVLNSFNIHIFAGGQGSWVEPNGRHYAPLPRLPWQEDDVAEVPQ